MNYIKFAGLAAGVALMLPFAASASQTQTFLTLNGEFAPTVQTGSTLDAKLTFDLTGVSTVQSVKFEVVDGSGNPVMPPTCVAINPAQNSAGTHTAQFQIPLTGGTGTEGTWDIRTTVYGDTIPANNPNCNGSEGFSNTNTFVDQLTLTANGSTGTVANNTGTGTGTTGSISAIDQLTALVTQLAAQVSCITTGGTFAANVCTHAPPVNPLPNANALCTELNTDLAAASAGTRSDANVTLQGFLLSKGMSIPAFKAGASFGFFGTQTQNAVTMFENANHCN